MCLDDASNLYNLRSLFHDYKHTVDSPNRASSLDRVLLEDDHPPGGHRTTTSTDGGHPHLFSQRE